MPSPLRRRIARVLGTQPAFAPSSASPLGQGWKVFLSASFRECGRKQTCLEVKRPEFQSDPGHSYLAAPQSFVRSCALLLFVPRAVISVIL